MDGERNRFKASYLASAIVVRLTRTLTPRTALALAPRVGRLMARLDPGKKRVLENFRIAFGGSLASDQSERLADRFYTHLARLACEFAWLSRWDKSNVLDYMRIRNLHYLDDALSEGKGAILISGHVGNWEISAAAMVHLGYKILVVARDLGQSPGELWLRQTRAAHGVPVTLETRPRECLAWLRHGGVVILLIDRRHSPGGVCVPFFGQAAASVAGPAKLAMLTGATVLSCGSWRRLDGTFLGEVEPPLPLIRTGDAERDVWLNTAQYQAAIEGRIRRYPEQWIWHRRRWRLRRHEPGALYEQLVAAGEPGRTLSQHLPSITG